MKQDIYELLNDVEIDLSQLEQEDFTELERKRIIKRFKKESNKNKGYKKYAGVAMLIMSTGILGSAPILATTNPIAYSIANFLGIEKDLDRYTTVIDKAITKGEITIQLNEVILDEDELIVSIAITSPRPIEGKHVRAAASIYINGREINCSAGGGSEQVDDYTMEEVMHYKLDKVYTGDIDIALAFNSVKIGDTRQIGPWKFEFRTNGEELAIKTRNQKLDQVFILPNESQITFTRYTANDIGEKVYFTLSNPEVVYDIQLKGIDDLGNTIVFCFSNQKGGDGILKLNDYFSNKEEGSKRYTLGLYVVEFPEESGQLSNDFKQIGDTFDIVLE